MRDISVTENFPVSRPCFRLFYFLHQARPLSMTITFLFSDYVGELNL